MRCPHAHMCARAHTSMYSRVHMRCQCTCTLTCECWWGFTSHVRALARVCVHSCVCCCMHVACTCVCLHLPMCSPMCPIAHTCAWQRRCPPRHSGAGGARGLSTGPHVRMAAVHEGRVHTRSTQATAAQGLRMHETHVCIKSHTHTRAHLDVHEGRERTRTHMHTRTYMCTRTCVYARTCVHKDPHTHKGCECTRIQVCTWAMKA